MSNRLIRYCEGVMEACWLLALILAPLFFNVYSSRVFEPDKIALVRSLALITAAAWLIKISAEGGFRLTPVETTVDEGATKPWAGVKYFLRQPLTLPVLALIFSYTLSTALSVSTYASLLGSYQRMQGTFSMFSYIVLFAAIVGNLRQRAQAERLITTVIITSLPIAMYGILQRYKLDPLPWGGDTVDRVTSNMGNAIFVAAYLIMAVFLCLGRVVISFHSILTSADDFARNMIRATSYVFILAINLVAIYFTQSRGPWLGLLAGLFFFFVLLSLQWHVRPLTLASIALAGLAGVFLILINIPNSPIANLKEIPGVGRLGSVLDTEGGTNKVRILIWGGIVELMSPHEPLEYPDGRPDPWNIIRPLVGYGPESLYVSYNRFYPPALANIEARNATPDRSHNETFDSLAFTGFIGLGVYLGVFVSVFYYGLKWLGLVGTRTRLIIFLILVLGGGLASSIGFILWQGPHFFGVGLPSGMLVGLIVYLALYALRSMTTKETEGNIPERWRAIAMISVISAIVAHFAEIHFGIAIVSTRTHFWIFAGLLAVLGYWIPATRAQATTATPTVNPAPTSGATARRKQQRRGGNSGEVNRTPASLGPLNPAAGIMTAILLTLGFDFITNSGHITQFDKIISDALTVLPNQGNKTSYGVLAMIVLTWLIGTLLLNLEEASDAREKPTWGNIFASLWLTLFLGFISWLILASQLANIAGFVPQSVEQLLESTSRIAGVLGLFYFLIFAIVLGLGVILPGSWPGGAGRPLGGMTLMWATTLPLAAVIFSVLYNLQLIQADIIYKTGLQFDDQGQPQLSIKIYEQAINLTPGQDYYYLFLGRSYLNYTGTITDTVQQQSGLNKAEEELIRARLLNPLNTDHSANLGRLNRQWAALVGDPTVRQEKAGKSDKYYGEALSLSPHSAALWDEWAALDYQLRDDLDGAQAKLDKSFELDKLYDQTYQLQGDVYNIRAQRATTDTERAMYYQKAIDNFNNGIAVMKERGGNPVNLYIGLAQAYVATQQNAPAIEAYKEVTKIGLGGNQWQVYRAIAELSRQLGDLEQGRIYGQLAADAAPEGEKPNLQAFVSSLGVSETPWQTYRTIAEVYQNLGSPAQAQAYGQQALAVAPETEQPSLQAWFATLQPLP